MTDHDERPRWQTTMMGNHAEKGPPWRETTLMKKHPDIKLSWWQTTLLNAPWCETTLVKIHPDKKLSWWQTTLLNAPWWETTTQGLWYKQNKKTLMKDHPDKIRQNILLLSLCVQNHAHTKVLCSWNSKASMKVSLHTQHNLQIIPTGTTSWS